MRKEIITDKHGISMMVMFILGSTLVLGVSTEARQDVWISIILAVIFVIPVMAVYARILALFPEKNLYEILNIIFGKFAGRIIALFFIWYSFHLGVLVLRNFQEFIKAASLPETPGFVSVMLIGILCIWVVKEGIEVLGRWSQLIILVLISMITIVTALAMTKANLNNMRPVLYNGIRPVFSGAFSIFSFPFAETVVFMTALNFDKKRNNGLKIYYYSLAIGTFYILLLNIRNMLVLGPDFISMLYFPSHVAISLINIGNFLQRIEVAVAVVFIFAGFVKISICLLGACKGLDIFFNIGNYRQIVAPVGLLMIVTSCFIYQNIMEMQEWAFKVYKYYAFPFQVILPLLIWIIAEMKAKKSNGGSK